MHQFLQPSTYNSTSSENNIGKTKVSKEKNTIVSELPLKTSDFVLQLQANVFSMKVKIESRIYQIQISVRSMQKVVNCYQQVLNLALKAKKSKFVHQRLYQ
jgi:hypothetical protein